MPQPDAPTEGRIAADRFALACERMVSVLPRHLERVVPSTLVGFAAINSLTFGVDLVVLTVLHGGLRWPLAVSVVGGYAVASSLSFLLNRSLNFRSHAPAGRQTARYLVVVAVNFVVILLGVTTGLAGLGVDYQLARALAGVCEGVFVYVAMRWFVFGA